MCNYCGMTSAIWMLINYNAVISSPKGKENVLYSKKYNNKCHIFFQWNLVCVERIQRYLFKIPLNPSLYHLFRLIFLPLKLESNFHPDLFSVKVCLFLWRRSRAFKQLKLISVKFLHYVSHLVYLEIVALSLQSR